MELGKDRSTLADTGQGCDFEWLETNGLGGWSGSSVIGCHTRRYHGLLVASINPPTDRMVLLSKLDESLTIGSQRFELGVNDYGDCMTPNGNQYLTKFAKGLFPEWTYAAGGIVLKKTLAMVQGENTVVITYLVEQTPGLFIMELLPLVAARGYHSLQHSCNNIFWDVSFNNGLFHNQPYEDAPDIFIYAPSATYHHNPRWFYHFNYRVEKYRGLDYTEDLFNHGILSVELKKGDVFSLIISTENPQDRNSAELLETEIRRKQKLIADSGSDVVKQLIIAADQFIVRRDISQRGNAGSASLKTIIAGYHWFTDWGRDTMISIPGLCLSTKRYEDAKKILSAFSRSISMGMLPNRFQDNNAAPEYNNVDGTLWYFISIYKYWLATKDSEFVIDSMLPVLKDIIDWHYRGTRYNIHVDSDGLLYAGEKGQQLTWMDARIGDWVVTPRMGKPVEIQALWYNALCIFSELLTLNGQHVDGLKMAAQASLAKESFLRLFWNPEAGCLFDCIDETGKPDGSLRPNQLFAMSLPFALIEGEKAKSVLNIVSEKLYTPVGLRSLSPDDSRYIGIYGGNLLQRDSAYHQGTVWSWLLGPYVESVIKIELNGRMEARQLVEAFIYHLNEGCIGSVSEIMDGNGSHHPRGCIAQAWGVAEILRVIEEYKILE